MSSGTILTDSTGGIFADCLTVKLTEAVPLVIVTFASRSAKVSFALAVTVITTFPAGPELGCSVTQAEAFVSVTLAVQLSGAVKAKVSDTVTAPSTDRPWLTIVRLELETSMTLGASGSGFLQEATKSANPAVNKTESADLRSFARPFLLKGPEEAEALGHRFKVVIFYVLALLTNITNI